MNLTVHNVYFCFSEVGCTISLRDGTSCKEVPAMQPTLFVAQQADMVCTDPKAVVRELPNGVELLHGQMMAGQPETGINLMKYAACVDAKAVYEADPDINQWTGTSNEGGRGYQFLDVRPDGSIPFSFDSLKGIGSMSGGYAHNMFDYLVRQRGVKKLHLKLPIITDWVGINGLEEITLDAPNLIRFNENYSRSLKRLKVNSLKIISLMNAAWLSPIESIEGEFPVLESGKISENNGILDKASVLRICNTVPTWTRGTHELWLGIHIDHQQDEDVLAAIANAESKGWTLTVQWNGTPTAQASVTYGLRKPPIYARVGKMERPDGTTERVLEWGHYVTDQSGYEEFRSVEAAREYFGLPEEDLT